MATQPSNYLSPEQYLAKERAAEFKSEYFQGEMFAMSGTSRKHSLIVTNLVSRLDSLLNERDCEVHSTDLRLLVSETGLYTYPDVMVVCGKAILADDHFDILTNPTLIIEVLSPSTANYDRGGKFHQYMQLPSLREYLTVSQSEMLVDQSVRQPDGGWLMKEIRPDAGSLALASLGIELSFAGIYRKVEFKPSGLPSSPSSN